MRIFSKDLLLKKFEMIFKQFSVKKCFSNDLLVKKFFFCHQNIFLGWNILSPHSKYLRFFYDWGYTRWVIVNNLPPKSYGEKQKKRLFFQILKFLAFYRRLGKKCIKISKNWAKKRKCFLPKFGKYNFYPQSLKTN